VTTKKIKIAVDKHGLGNLWSFRALGPKGEALLRDLFPQSQWLGRTMYADHHYNVQCAQVLERNGARLVREEDGKKITAKSGDFLLLGKAA
jgi:uncharacterized protein YjlB